MTAPQPTSIARFRDGVRGLVPRLLERMFGAPPHGWELMPKELRNIIAGSPLVLLLPLLLAIPIPGASYEWNGEDVSREEFLLYAWPLAIATIVGAAVLVYALWTERRWIRAGAVAAIVAFMVYNAWINDFAVTAFGWFTAAIPVAMTVWFWYFKESIHDYYLLLEDPVDRVR